MPRRLLLVHIGLAALGCGARTGLLFDEGTAVPIDAGKPRLDPCAVNKDEQSCLRAGCDFVGCGRGAADAEGVSTVFACVTTNGPVPSDLCP